MGGTPTARPTMNPAGVEASLPFEMRVEPLARKPPPDSPGPFPASLIDVSQSRKEGRGHGGGGMRIGIIGAGNVTGPRGTGNDPEADRSEGTPRYAGTRIGGGRWPCPPGKTYGEEVQRMREPIGTVRDGRMRFALCAILGASVLATVHAEGCVATW